MNVAVAIGGGEAVAEFQLSGEGCIGDVRGALYLPEGRILVVSDLHLEKGAARARRGQLLPPYDTAQTLALLARSLRFFDPLTVVCLGDSFDDAGGSGAMPDIFRAELRALMAGRDWYWVEGNHDPLPPQGLEGESVRELAAGRLRFVHQPSPGHVPGEVAGHLHPGARIVRRGRSVRRRCFATDGDRLVMPAFGAFTGQLNVRDRAFAGLFREETLVAWMLGAERLFALPRRQLVAG